MKAVYITQYGNANVLGLQNLPQPSLGKDEALIRLKAAGLNFIDIYMRKGDPIIPVPLPFVPGVEGSGIVEAIGEEVTEVKPGDRVAYFGQLGSYAEYNVVKASQLIPIPSDFSFELGAAFPLQGMTAQYLVHDCHAIKKDDTVLVHAAAGGVGLLLVQWLKHLGARVIGTVSNNIKAKAAYKAGADHIIIYTEEDFVTETKKLTHGEGADYIIDGVGKSTFTKDLEAIKTRGCICIFGLASGIADPISPNLLQNKSITLCGGNLMNYLTSRSELLRRANQVINGIRKGWLKISLDHVFSLDQAAQAQQLLEERKTLGKVIIKISE